MSVMNAFTMHGQTAIVTGAGSGIGRRIAETFANAGANVVVSDLVLDRAKEVAQAIQADGGSAVAVRCDVTKDFDLVTLRMLALTAFQKITVLVNNADSANLTSREMSILNFQRSYAFNVFPALRMSELCAPCIEEAGGGAILHVSPVAQISDHHPMSYYASSRDVLDYVTQHVALELDQTNIRVNGIAPLATEADANAAMPCAEAGAAVARYAQGPKVARPDSLGCAALFLCSPASARMSGQILTVGAAARHRKHVNLRHTLAMPGI